MIESVSDIFVFRCVDGFWGREAENAVLYLHRIAPILALELINPLTPPPPAPRLHLTHPDLNRVSPTEHSLNGIVARGDTSGLD